MLVGANLSVCHASEGWHPARRAQRKKNWMPAFAGMTVVLALCFITPAHAADLAAVRSITVTGQSERKVVPDEAHLNVNLNSLAQKLPEAKAEHDKKLKQLLDIVEKAGISEKKVKTGYASSEPQYDYANNQRVFKGYRVQTQLDITVSPIDKVAALMESLTNAGFEKGASTEWGNLLSVSYGVAEPEKIRDAMLADAISNARAKAENMAKAAGASIGAVQQIQEGNSPSFNYPRPVPMMAMAKMAVAETAPVAPPAGEQQMQASVTVTFELR